MGKNLTAGRAVFTFLAALSIIMAGNILFSFVPVGWNIWITQMTIVIFAFALTLKNDWSFPEVFRFRGTDFATVAWAFVLGIGMWWGGLGFNVLSARFVDNLLGPLNVDIPVTIVDIFLVPFAIVIMAPFCEEILFRGYRDLGGTNYTISVPKGAAVV